MPYKNKSGTKWIAQVRKNGKRQNKVFQTKKEAVDWEVQDAAKARERLAKEDRHGLYR